MRLSQMLKERREKKHNAFLSEMALIEKDLRIKLFEERRFDTKKKIIRSRLFPSELESALFSTDLLKITLEREPFEKFDDLMEKLEAIGYKIENRL